MNHPVTSCAAADDGLCSGGTQGEMQTVSEIEIEGSIRVYEMQHSWHTACWPVVSEAAHSGEHDAIYAAIHCGMTRT
jgi:hypothetical protein